MSMLRSLLLLLSAVASEKTYVVHTEDNNLHFVSSTVETHRLYLEPAKPIEEAPMRYIGSLPSAGSKESSVARTNRLDRIYVTDGGILDLFGRKIFVDEILSHPLVEDGIYIAASQGHQPSILNNTVVITAVTRVHILDLFTFRSRILRFSQILYLYEVFQDIPMREREIFLNGQWWRFDGKIRAVYALKEKDGLHFMMRILDKSDVALFRHKAKQAKSRKLYIVGVLAGALGVFFYLGRNLRFGPCIIKHKLHAGRFVKNNCLIYKVTDSFLEEHRRIYSKLKGSGLVSILSEEGWFKPLIITECTTQFAPQYEKLSKANLSSESVRTYADYFTSEVYSEAHEEASRKFKSSLLAIIQSLHLLHTSGVVHGRLGPENIRVSSDGQIKLQNILDNHGWRSARQLKNSKTRSFRPDETDDIFSLGCLLHFYLTGYHPYDLRGCTRKDKVTGSDELTDETPPEEPAAEQGLSDQGLSDQGSKAAGQGSSKQGSSKTRIFSLRPVLAAAGSVLKWMLLQLWKVVLFSGRILGVLAGISHIQRLISRVSAPYHYFTEMVMKAHRSTLGRLAFFAPAPTCSPPSQIYNRVLSDEISKYIEYNVLYSTYQIRLEEQTEHDLIYHCLKAPEREVKQVFAAHPYFWDNEKSLEFICDASDFIETNPALKPRLERSKKLIFKGSWIDRLDKSMVMSASVKRTYDHKSLCDLIRFIRNCHRHYQELRNDELFGILEGRLFFYLSHAFPYLLMFLYRHSIVKNHAAMRKYYEL